MIFPMKQAFNTNSYKNKSIRDKVLYFTSRHLQYRAMELYMKNIGPWVRAYMDNHDGTQYAWCQGFVCTILDQTFSSIGKIFDNFYANTWRCEDFRQHAIQNNLLISEEKLKTGKYIPLPGDISILVQKNQNKALHIEIIYSVDDKINGHFRSIGGNTNLVGNRDGIGIFIVDRNFKNNDNLKYRIEIIRMIDAF